MTGWADIDHNLKEAMRLKTAAIKLYNAGRWTCATVPPWDAEKLWEELRDAAGIPLGTETSRADEEKKVKLKKLLCEHFDNLMSTDAAADAVIKMLGDKP